MHRPNFSMPLPSVHLQAPKEQLQFGPPILVTTPCEDSIAMPYEPFTQGLAPMAMSPPRTPLPKADYEADLWKRHSLCSDDDEEMTRPSSAASMYSSSSACSFGSMTSFNSFPASAESPRHEKTNSFGSISSSFSQEVEVDNDNSMDLVDTQRTPRARRPHKQDSTKDADWSKTFDLHLWGAYISYQGNPTVTPFYVPPGGCPPIGVCIRVAREAKRTWRVPKTVQETDLTSPTERLSRTNSDNLLPVDANLGEGSLRRRRGSRSHASRRKEMLPRMWPYSEAATRQRLRILSRRITENPHLQTRHGRLASPIHMKEFAPPRANIVEESQYSTRSLSFSLVTSTSESMQVTGPLARLSRQFDAEDLCLPQGDVPSAHDVFKPTLEPSYEVEDELDAVVSESVIPSGHRRSLSTVSAHRRSGSKNSILHRKTEGNGIGHRRTTSATANVTKSEQTTDNFATPRKRNRVRSSSDATIRSSIPRMLCLGSPFGAVEEEGDEASRHARRTVHKRHQSLEAPLGKRPAPALMPAFDFTKQVAYQNALRQQEQEKLAQQQTRPTSTLEGKRKDHFFDDLFGANGSRTNLSERSSTPSVSGSDGASIRVPSKKTRARGMSFTDKLRGNASSDFVTPVPSRRISAPPDHLRVERPSVLKRLGSPFRDAEFTPLDSTLNQSQITLPDAPPAELPATLGSAFTSPPRTKKRDTAVTPSRERGILGFGLGFFRRGKKDTSQQH
ncbi:hypothetical protein H072_8767 [Dactylellina haptotyla CBS 200.50]|uniref:Uncharacterized protein n=1 Tax=Dactylellina haptotyla (strain CBS 200.50) TaxID=1284197 RepID=S8BE67_DACHA|nr:hypothetical protein H072_8767 [Dactylellina haptotyla CBS 200.50]